MIEEKFGIHTNYDIAWDVLTEKAHFHSKGTSQCGIFGGEIDSRTLFFPSTSVLPSHCHSIHILVVHTHLFIASLIQVMGSAI